MIYELLYIPGIMILLLPFVKIVHDAHKATAEKKRRIAEKERREAARREALRQAMAEREAQKAAEEAAKAAVPKRRPGRPRKNPAPIQRPETISQEMPKAATPVAAPAAPVMQEPVKRYVGNNVFAGETVSFTGTLPGMTRREAIEAVRKNGGMAFESMPAATTILVVGDRPGKRKLDNADKWIGSCRKISAMEFSIMLHTPLTLTPKEFADYVHALHGAA